MRDGSGRPRIGNAKCGDEVIADRIVRAKRQAAKEIGQRAGILIVNRRPRINTVSNLMAVRHGHGEPLNGVLRSTILPTPSKLNIRKPDAISDNLFDIRLVRRMKSGKLSLRIRAQSGPCAEGRRGRLENLLYPGAPFR